ncbi:MAG TPA: F0F1 ATP synthase subunit alpha, partial [Gemmataceae bacterium]|nr:F0F1 ATP synthase subunit alpha [Gemmataceae bacterium]
SGAIDKIDRKKVKDWEEQFLNFMRTQRKDVRALIAKERDMTADAIAKLNAAIEEFKPLFKG